MISTVEDMEKELQAKDETIQTLQSSLEEIKNESEHKKSTIEELSKQIESLEAAHQVAIDNLVNTQGSLVKYKKHFERQATRKAKCEETIRISFGILLLAVGVVLIIVSIAALIPTLSKLVAPAFVWIKTSTIMENTSDDTIVTILVALGIAAIPAGLFLLKPGYKKLKYDSLNKSLTELESKN